MVGNDIVLSIFFWLTCVRCAEQVEHAVETHVTNAEAMCGLWVRNGDALLNTLHNQHQPISLFEVTVDMDVILMQTAIQLLGTNHFLCMLTHAFVQVHAALCLDDSGVNTETVDPHVKALHQRMLVLLVGITTHRYRFGENHMVDSLQRLPWVLATLSCAVNCEQYLSLPPTQVVGRYCCKFVSVAYVVWCLHENEKLSRVAK